MNRKTISDALDLMDVRYVSEAMKYGDQYPALEGSNMVLIRDNGKFVKKVITVAAAVCLVLAVGVTAYAADMWGIRDMLGHRRLNDEAAGLIQPHSESKTDGTITARITETLCDGDTLMVAITVCGSDDMILAEADASVRDSAMDYGANEDITLGEYAEKNHKVICPVTASVEGVGVDLGTSGFEISYRRHADNELTVLLIADGRPSTDTVDLICSVYVNHLDKQGKRTDQGKHIEIPFTVTKGATKERGVYSPVMPETSLGFSVGDAVVTDTALGLSVRMPVTVTDDDAFYNTLMECEGVAFEGGLVLENDGVWYTHWIRGSGDIGDSFTVHCYDLNTNELICDIEFVKNDR